MPEIGEPSQGGAPSVQLHRPALQVTRILFRQLPFAGPLRPAQLVLIAGLQLRRLHGLAAHVGEAVVPTARRSPQTPHVPRRVMSPPSSPRASVSRRHSFPPSVRLAVSPPF